MLGNGERQVAPTLEGIRRDHVARYQFAASLIDAGDRVVDAACGIGYGAAILADAGAREVLAIDNAPEAIAFGLENYNRPAIRFQTGDVMSIGLAETDAFDLALSFETIEHLADPLPFLKSLARVSPMLVASVPNETVFPYRNYRFHYRHYTREQFADLLRAAGWRVVAWYGQEGVDSDLARDCEGRSLVACCERIAATAERDGSGYTATMTIDPDAFMAEMPTPADAAPSGTDEKPVPDHVAIVGLGPTCAVFFELTRRYGGVSAYCDEVWGINALGDVLCCDRVFHMDDVRTQERRAAAQPNTNIAAMLRWLKTHKGPIYTSIPHKDYPGTVAFPLEAVLNATSDANGGAPYFNSTAAYAIALAVHLGVRRISLFGLDYTLQNAHRAEQGRACCEFWLGVAAARGIEIAVPSQTSLLDACTDPRDRLYGYDFVDVSLDEDDTGRLTVSMTERADPPSAAEFEHRYDHSRHTNPMMRAADRPPPPKA